MGSLIARGGNESNSNPYNTKGSKHLAAAAAACWPLQMLQVLLVTQLLLVTQPLLVTQMAVTQMRVVCCGV